MNGSSSALFWYLVGIGAIGVIVYLLVFKRKRPSTTSVKSKKREFEKTEEEIIDELIKELARLEEKYYPEFLAYAMYRENKERGWDYKVKVEEKIFEKYGKQLGMPTIDVFEIKSIHFDYLDKAMEKYLREKGFPIDHNKRMKKNFNNYLYTKAREQAKKEIEELIKENGGGYPPNCVN